MDMGTTPLRAPEVFAKEDNEDMKNTKAADVYSFAMVFFEVLTGKAPFSDVCRKELIRKFAEGRGLLYHQRPTAQCTCQHSYPGVGPQRLKNGLNFLKSAKCWCTARS